MARFEITTSALASGERQVFRGSTCDLDVGETSGCRVGACELEHLVAAAYRRYPTDLPLRPRSGVLPSGRGRAGAIDLLLSSAPT
jgi:hypothetical protein